MSPAPGMMMFGLMLEYQPVSLALTCQFLAAEKKALQVGKEIKISIEKDFWPTQKSRLCDWCAFKDICPAYKS